MKKSFVVFGLGRFGFAAAIELYNQGADVMVIDADEDKINAITKSVTVAICANITNRSSVASIGLENFDGAIVAMSESLEGSIMAIMLSKQAGIPNIWVKAKDDMQSEIFNAVGATKVFVPEREQAISLARSMASGLSLDFFELSDKIDVIKMPLPDAWDGKTLVELSLRKKYGINVIGVESKGEVRIDMRPDEKLHSGMQLFIVADRKHSAKLLNSL